MRGQRQQLAFIQDCMFKDTKQTTVSHKEGWQPTGRGGLFLDS